MIIYCSGEISYLSFSGAYSAFKSVYFRLIGCYVGGVICNPSIIAF